MDKPQYQEHRFGPLDYVKIAVLGFALSAVSNTMHAIILPMRIRDFFGPLQQSTYLGLITFTGLIIAMLVQPLAGAISDRAGFRWSRRKPFILIGVTATILFLLSSGSAGTYVAIFVFWCLAQTSLNIAQGPFQAFIPDLAPPNKRGLASGVKNLLEIAGIAALAPVIGIFMGHYAAAGGSIWLWYSLGLLGLVLLVTMLISLFTVKERPGREVFSPPGISWLYNIFRIDTKVRSWFILFLVSRLLFIMGFTTIQSFALYYFQDVIGFTNPAEVTASLITSVGIAMLIVVYPAGRLSDKIGRRPLLVSSGLLAALGVGLIYFARDYFLIVTAGCLIGIAAAVFLSVNWALATDLIPKEEVARYLGLTNLATAGGAALARLIGPVIDYFNRQEINLGYSVMLGACFAYFILSSLLITRVKKPEPPLDIPSPEG
jgi:Na+/melibiose symporter-like transporter